MSVDTRVLPSGDLEISLIDGEEYDCDRLCSMTPEQALGDLLEHQIGNGWDLIDPEDVGALTDSPIISDDVTIEDDGTRTISGNVWWFPNYQIENPVGTLCDKRRVIFAHVPGDPSPGASWGRVTQAKDECDCGAATLGVGPGQPGHYDWCKVR